MRFTNTILLLGSATVGLAFHIPAGKRDGFYRAFINERGDEVHEPVTRDMLRRAGPGANAGASPDISKRATTWEVHCGCGAIMDSTECDAAVADLKTQVGDGVYIPAGSSYYSISGGTVAFGCNTGPVLDMYMSSSTVGTVTDRLTTDCGLYVAGTGSWYRDGAVEDIAYTGYMAYTDGLDFCANALTSSADSC